MGKVSRQLEKIFELNKQTRVQIMLDCKLKKYPAGFHFKVKDLKAKRFIIYLMNSYLPIGTIESLAGGLDIFSVIRTFAISQMRFQTYPDNPAKDMPKIFSVGIVARFNL